MKKVEKELEDDLRPEYDLKGLRVRKTGPDRKGFYGSMVQLEPDVAEVFRTRVRLTRRAGASNISRDNKRVRHRTAKLSA